MKYKEGRRKREEREKISKILFCVKVLIAHSVHLESVVAGKLADMALIDFIYIFDIIH